MIRILQFGRGLQVRYTSTQGLRNFWPSYREWNRYHITICQVNPA